MVAGSAVAIKILNTPVQTTLVEDHTPLANGHVFYYTYLSSCENSFIKVPRRIKKAGHIPLSTMAAGGNSIDDELII